jgi:hypothetical protein
MNQLNPIVTGMIRNEIIRCIKELLEKKHLYQSVRIDTTNVARLIDNVEASKEMQEYIETISLSSGMTGESGSARHMPNAPNIVEQHIQEVRKNMKYTCDFILESFWSFSTDANNQDADKKDDSTNFVLPTISVRCESKECNSIQAHNSGFRDKTQEFQAVPFKFSKGGKQIPFQTFVFPYQCQKCKQEPLVFLVHREGEKLTLAGRNHFENVQVPQAIPKEERKYFSAANIAYNTGYVLAGLFLLRTTIEQYMRRIVKVSGNTRITGEELAEEYTRYLADDFPKRYHSMKVIYVGLSVALHSADANSTLFEKFKENIEGHFDLLKHYPLRKRKRKLKNHKRKQ